MRGAYRASFLLYVFLEKIGGTLAGAALEFS